MWRPAGYSTNFEGVRLEAFRSLVQACKRGGRGLGDVQLVPHGDRWVLAIFPLHIHQPTFVGHYLMSEKSKKPRYFATSDTALKLLREHSNKLTGAWVLFRDSQDQAE